MAISTGFEINPRTTQPIREGTRSMLDQYEQMDKLFYRTGAPTSLSYPEKLRNREVAERELREIMGKEGDDWMERLTPQEMRKLDRIIMRPVPPMLPNYPMPRFDPIGVPIRPGDRGPAPRVLPELPRVWQNDPTADPGYF